MIVLLSLCLTFFPALSFAAEPFFLVSGFDDVVKQAENQNLAKAAFRLLKADQTFTGMPELYRGLTQAQTQEIKFFLVSGTS